MVMEWEGRVAGVFEGYASGRVFELSDGRRWRQEGGPSEYAYREQPLARLLWEQGTGTRYLDVEGTSSIVKVVPDGGMRGMGSGAY